MNQLEANFAKLNTSSGLVINVADENSANSFAGVKISFFNSIGLKCEGKANFDAEAICRVFRESDPRCSPRYTEFGRAFGGYCLPKDTAHFASGEYGNVARGAMEINAVMISRGLVREPPITKSRMMESMEVVSGE